MPQIPDFSPNRCSEPEIAPFAAVEHALGRGGTRASDARLKRGEFPESLSDPQSRSPAGWKLRLWTTSPRGSQLTRGGALYRMSYRSRHPQITVFARVYKGVVKNHQETCIRRHFWRGGPAIGVAI